MNCKLTAIALALTAFMLSSCSSNRPVSFHESRLNAIQHSSEFNLRALEKALADSKEVNKVLKARKEELEQTSQEAERYSQGCSSL